VKSKKGFKEIWRRKLQALPLMLLLLGGIIGFGANAGFVSASESTGFFWAATYTAERSEALSLAYSDSGLAFIGWLNGAGVDHSSAWIVKVNDDGSIAWQKAATGNYGFNDIEATGDGYIAVGWANGAEISQNDAWLVKFDEDGNVVWQKAIGGDGDQKAVAVSGDAFVGTYNGFPWIVTFDENGSVNWEAVLKGEGSYGFTNVLKDYKYYYAVGWLNGAPLVVKFKGDGSKTYWQNVIETSGKAVAIAPAKKGTVTAVITSDGSLLVKFDYFGHLKWEKLYRGVQIRALYRDGDYIIAAGEMGGKTLVMKLDGDGNVIKAVTYGSGAFNGLALGDEKAFLAGVMSDNALAMAVPAGDLTIPSCELVAPVDITGEDVNLSVNSAHLILSPVESSVVETNAEFINTTAEFSSLKAIAPVLSVSDPEGDDHGPGTYTYPTDPVFNRTGLFDIIGMDVYETPNDYVFYFHFKNLGDNQWNGPNGFSYQIIEAYFDFKDGGNTSAIKLADNGPGANVQLNRPWDLAFRVTGWTSKLVLPNMSTVDIEANADLSTNTIIVKVPREYLNFTEDTFYAVLVGAQDGVGGIDQWRKVDVNASQWMVGGADSDAIIAGVAPRVMDLLVPEWFHPTQEEQLSGYDAEDKKLATVDMIPVSENYGFLTVISTPSGAEVSIDGESVGTTPLKYYLVPAGEHNVTVSMRNYHEYKETVTVEPKEVTLVNATLEVLKGKLTITSEPTNATVIIDGNEVGKTPLENYTLPVGLHQVIVKMPGYKDEVFNVSIQAGKLLTFHVELSPKTGMITINSNPSGAEVYIDGQKVGETPLEHYVLPIGLHQVLIKKEGYKDEVFNVSIQEGKELTFNVELSPKTGMITITTDPSGAEVYIDGLKVGETPLEQYVLTVGKHTIVIKKEGYKEETHEITVEAGKELKLNYKLTPLHTTTTTTTTTTTSTTTSKGGGGTKICGPAALIGLAIIPLLLRRRK